MDFQLKNLRMWKLRSESDITKFLSRDFESENEDVDLDEEEANNASASD